jgi:hypothetical protein
MEDTIGQPSHATTYMNHPSSNTNDFLPYKLPTITTPKIVGAIMKNWTLCVKHQHHVYISMCKLNNLVYVRQSIDPI